MRKWIVLAIVVGLASAGCRPYLPVGDAGDGSDFDYCHEFAKNELLLFWSFNTTDVTFALQGRTLGWIGMSFGNVVGDDLYVSFVESDVPYVYDYHDHNPDSFYDAVQDATVIGGSENATLGFTSLVFSRPLNATTGDEDWSIDPDADLQLHFAYHTDDLTPGDPTSLSRHNIRNFSPDPIVLSAAADANDPVLACYNGQWGPNCEHQCPGIANGTVIPLYDDVCTGHGTCDDGMSGDGTCNCNEVENIIPEPTAATGTRQISGDGRLYYGEACDLLCAIGCGFDCDQVTGGCATCQTGYWGAPTCDECEFPLCSGHGLCSSDTGDCTCFGSWEGEDCSIDPNAGAGSEEGLQPEVVATVVVVCLALMMTASVFVIVQKLLENKRKALGLPSRSEMARRKKNFKKLDEEDGDKASLDGGSKKGDDEGKSEEPPAAPEAPAAPETPSEPSVKSEEPPPEEI